MNLSADEAFDRKNRVLRVGDGLPLGDLSHQPLAAFGDGHHGRGGAAAFRIGDHLGVAAFHNGHTGIGGSEIDSDNLAHLMFLLTFDDP